MKRKILLGLGGLAAAAVLIASGALGFSTMAWDNPRDVDEVGLVASDDPEIIEKGAYLAYGPAHCAYCHTTAEAWPRLDAGERLPMSGGLEFALPFGAVYSENITPDPETGIGSATDGQLARMLRHNVRVDGRVAMPFMEFQNLSDEDVVALISFLRSQEPVRNVVPAARLNLMGKAIMTFLVKPLDGDPPATAPAEEATIVRGEYLVNNVANCVGCHTNRSMTDGSYTGPRLAGGFVMMSETDPTHGFVTPNLTPDPETGRIANWSEDQFLARFRAGAQLEGSAMPWNAYRRMSDTDIRAVYRYLRSLDAVSNATPMGAQPMSALES